MNCWMVLYEVADNGLFVCAMSLPHSHCLVVSARARDSFAIPNQRINKEGIWDEVDGHLYLLWLLFSVYRIHFKRFIRLGWFLMGQIIIFVFLIHSFSVIQLNVSAYSSSHLHFDSFGWVVSVFIHAYYNHYPKWLKNKHSFWIFDSASDWSKGSQTQSSSAYSLKSQITIITIL